MTMQLMRTEQRQRASTPPVRRCACGNIVGPDGECSACRAKRLMGHARSEGKPLPQPERGAMERTFGHDFSQVRIHADSGAARDAQSANAAAFTIGQNIVFGPGRYAPGTAQGKSLLAHELAHTIQQRGAASGLTPGKATHQSESEARRAASAVGQGKTPTTLSPVSAIAVARYPADEPVDTPDVRQTLCVIRLGGCPQTRPGGIPTDEEIAGYNTQCRSETSYSGPDITPSDNQCRNPPQLPSDALIFARSLNTLYPGWLSVLPPCPCTDAAAAASPNWAGPGACQPPYHIGAATGYRSTRGYPSVPGSNHGQQCCYDPRGNLITDGAGAGTPDIVQAPPGAGSAIGSTLNPFSSSPGVGAAIAHYFNDVRPFNELGWEIYNRYWVPNRGVNCPPNKVP